MKRVSVPQPQEAISPPPIQTGRVPSRINPMDPGANVSTIFSHEGIHHDAISHKAVQISGVNEMTDPALEVILSHKQEEKSIYFFINYLSSLLLHLILVVPFLFLCISPAPKRVLEVISQPGLAEELSLTEVFDHPGPEIPTEMEMASIPMDTPKMESQSEEITTVFTDTMAMTASLSNELGFDPVPVSDMTATLSHSVGNDLSGRGKNKAYWVASGGGSEGSERAVALALAWLSEHQLPNGGWSFRMEDIPTCRGKCRNSGSIGGENTMFGATAMALLPFLAAGNTPYDGKHKDTVRRGIQFLLKSGNRTPQGLSFMDRGSMYSHGLCTIVLCEVYTMLSPNERSRMNGLGSATVAALAFIEYAQDPIEGGWRYMPRQRGDTSVVGWQLMALKSGQIGRFSIKGSTMKKALNFLTQVVGDEEGSHYGYTSRGHGGTLATNAIGLLCRLFLDWKTNSPNLLSGADELLARGPDLGDPYYNYYATQLFHHIGYERWHKWNNLMRDPLVKSQISEGHEKGSWFPTNPNSHCMTGGRLYATALNCMILEVYYRHLPLYQKQATDAKFPLD